MSSALLGNAADFYPAPAARELPRALLKLPPPSAPQRIIVAEGERAALAGRYYAAQTDDLIRLTVRAGKPFGEGRGERVPIGPGLFTKPGGGTKFLFSTDPPRRLRITTRNAAVDYRAAATVTPTGAQLAFSAGTYRSAELAVAHRVTVEAGRLSVGHWPGLPLVAKPAFADGFRVGRGWHAPFTRDAAGAVTGDELTNGRCRHVRFSRQ